MTTLIGKEASNFVAPAVLANGEIVEKYDFHQKIKNRYALVFFYPLDFTFVCPSELIALDHRMDDFNTRDIEVAAVSVDSQFTHFAWRNTPPEKGGIGQVKYTIVSDVMHNICQAYGVQHPAAGVAFRAAFVIDKKSIVRAEIIHDLPFGRNIEEILRLFDAVDFHEKNGEVCPAGWHKGAKGMKATPAGVAEYLKQSGKDL